MKLSYLVAANLILLCMPALWGETVVDDLLNDKDVRPGLVIHLDCGNGKLTVELGSKQQAKVVQALSRSQQSVEKTRRLIEEKGMYGRVSAETFTGSKLPYPDNTANVMVVQDLRGLEKSGVALKELFRVVAPFGVVWIEGVNEKSIAEKLTSVFTHSVTISAHGSLVVNQDGVYVGAGRQTQLDGGLLYYALAPVTGKALWSSCLANLSRYETTDDLMRSDGQQLFICNDQMEGGYSVYTQINPHTGKTQRLSWQLINQDKSTPSGVSDMIWTSMFGFLRQQVYDGNIVGSRRHWYYHQTMEGSLLCVDGPRAWGIIKVPQNAGWDFYGNTQTPRFTRGNWVFGNGGAMPWQQQLEPSDTLRQKIVNRATVETPETILAQVRMNALVRAGDKLFVAAQPDEKPDAGTLTVFDADTGKILGEIPTPGAPCFDGLSAAARRLYLSCENGKIVCLGE